MGTAVARAKFSKLSRFWHALLFMASLLYANTSHAWYDLYCGSHPAAKDFECLPANVGNWLYDGGSYPYQLQYHKRASIEEIFEEFTSDIKSKYAVCSASLSVESILNDRFDFNSIVVRTKVVLVSPACSSNVDSLLTFTAWRNRSVTCDKPSQGPFYSPDNLPYCAFPLVYEDTSCPTDTPTFPGSGVKLLQEDDVVGAGVHPLSFTRHYRSRWPNGIPSASMPMGAGWTHTYDRSIHVIASPTPKVRALRGDGTWHTLVRDDASSTATSVTWLDISPSATQDRLTQKLASNGQTTSWVYRPHVDDSVETYAADGRLQTIMARNGGVTTLVYSDASTPPSQAPQAGLLLTVRNPFGRELRLSYDSAGRLATLSTPGGEVIRYAHDALGNLVAVTAPGADTNTPATQYLHYEDSRSLNIHALTGLTDALGVRITTYTYDALGQVATTEKARGLEKLTFISSPASLSSTIYYTPTPGAASTATQYRFSSQAGVLRPISVTKPCPLCGASAAATSYDANQRRSKVVAHDGTVNFFRYDAQGRVTEKATYPASYQSATTAPPLDAASTVTQTQWHGEWNLPLKIAEPGSITSYSYDERGNLTNLIETPTLDLIGRMAFNAAYTEDSKSTTWKYNDKNLPTTITEQINGRQTDRWILSYNEVAEITEIMHLAFDVDGAMHETRAILTPLGDGASWVSSILSMPESQVASRSMKTLAGIANSQSFLRPTSIAVVIPASILVTGGFFIAGTIITNNEPITWPNKTRACECDPPKGTICSEFHSGGTPHKLSDFEGNKLPADDEHVHTWQMNQLPDGTCIWNKRRAQKFTFNYTPVNARACQSYPSWVVQNGI